jgi:ubiquinol-cytochrome c reductase cytochrome b subunit
LRDAVACLAMLAIVLLLAVFKGAELSAPANPAEAFSAARPEWYFLSLFRLLRFEAIEHYGLAFGAIYLPAAVLLVMVCMPWIAMVKGGHRFNVAFMCLLTLGVAGLTVLAAVEDYRDADHQVALAEAERDAQRVVELASLPEKIPVDGAGALLQHDPFTQGPRVFAKYCASCHRFDGHDGRGRAVLDLDAETQQVGPRPAGAPDLHQFATRSWWNSILTNFEEHLAPVAVSGYDLEQSATDGMISWFRENQSVLRDPANQQDVAAMVEFLTSQNGRPDPTLNQQLIERGQEILASGELTAGSIVACNSCHAEVGGTFVAGTDNGGIPELNQYGSQAWLQAFLRDPGHAQFYGERNRMPAFESRLSASELDLLVRFLSGDYPATQAR